MIKPPFIIIGKPEFTSENIIFRDHQVILPGGDKIKNVMAFLMRVQNIRPAQVG
jgi:hypothetical protein